MKQASPSNVRYCLESDPDSVLLAAQQVVSTLLDPNATIKLPQTGLYSISNLEVSLTYNQLGPGDMAPTTVPTSFFMRQLGHWSHEQNSLMASCHPMLVTIALTHLRRVK